MLDHNALYTVTVMWFDAAHLKRPGHTQPRVFPDCQPAISAVPEMLTKAPHNAVAYVCRIPTQRFLKLGEVAEVITVVWMDPDSGTMIFAGPEDEDPDPPGAGRPVLEDDEDEEHHLRSAG